MMKIVYCHNYYRNRGGEDVSFECDLELLREQGHTVIPFTRNNGDIKGSSLRTAAKTLWNLETKSQMWRLLQREKPDLLHCNNLFPQISPSVYSPAKRMGIPIVQALRNYRTFCANSFLFRDGELCTKCLKSSAAWQGLRHKCYRDSLPATAVVVASQFANRALRIQRRYVDAFVTPTEFAKRIHVEGGFDASKIHSRANFILPDPKFTATKEPYLVFVGRLSNEKGLSSVLQAWRDHQPRLPLRIIGDGPQEQELRQQASGLHGVTFLGALKKEDVLKQIGSASALLMPSIWYETFGRTIAEAFACGTPVIASRLGAMGELVTDLHDGLLFEPGSPDSLAVALARFSELSMKQQSEMRRNARQTYGARFSPQVSYRELISIYAAAAWGHQVAAPLVNELSQIASQLTSHVPALRG